MAYIDLPLAELQSYLPPRSEPADFDAFWQATLEQARAYSLAAVFTPVDYGLSQLETFDVTFAGFDGQPIKGWLLLPKARKGPLPCVVEYLGYGGGRSFPPAWTVFPSAGWAHLVMDTRGQGSSWASGDTPDLGSDGAPEYPGVMTRGILAPRSYYYRRVFTDAVRAVEAARSHPAVDSGRIAVSGGSQGGGITLAVSGLLPDVQAALPDVPFLCHYHRATTLVDSFPYGEIRSYLKAHRNQVETVFQTLSYFDGLNFATRARATALFSVGLMDDICPPSTVYAAYNYYAGPKRICVYEFNQHDGGGIHQTNEKLAFLHKLWGE